MSNVRNKYQSRENRQRVREVLNQHWDPIGVTNDSPIDDEYDGYVGTIYVMLMDNRASATELEKYLQDTATGHMGLSNSDYLTERCATTAAILISLRPQFETP
jgi:hypothetical protein